jgi:glutathione S-transferase
MPSTITVGTPGAKNDKIGGVPHMHYFDLLSRGRGQVLRLLMEDAGIAYKDTRYSFEEFPAFKKGKILGMNPLGAVPVVELNGQALTQSYAIMRKWGRELGEYDGEGNEELYRVDLM